MDLHPRYAAQWFTLVRPGLSYGVSCAAVAVYLYYSRIIDARVFGVFGGVFLLSGGASALNQVQERTVDAFMERTKRRPLPSARFPVKGVLPFAVLAACAGFVVLFITTRPVAAMAGVLALLLYNGIYTPLKCRTPLVLFPGAVAGALPAIIGCSAATGSVDARAVVIAFFMFLWQIPHFLLLALRYEDDYRHAGIPTLCSRMSVERLHTVIAVWVLAAGGSTVLFGIYGIIAKNSLQISLLLLNGAVAVAAFVSLRKRVWVAPEWSLYAYQAAVMVLLAVQGLLH
jgi:protoheme IX farnesyltransferase